ncbi:MAG: glycosyltransferase family 4 protein [Bacteroidota bacterium]
MNSGGAERVASSLVNAWAERGDSVTLLVTYSGKGECFYALSEKVSLVYLADEAGCVGRGIRAYLLRFIALRRFIKANNPEFVVSFLTNVNIAAVLTAFGLGCRVLVSERIFPPLLPVGRIYDRLRLITYPLAYRVVMLTSEGMDWLRRRMPGAKGIVIPNPVHYPLPDMEPRLRPENYVPVGNKLLLAVGRLDRQKGFDVLLESFASLTIKYPHWTLVVLGEGPERDRLIAQVERLGLEGRVLIPGRAGNVSDWYTRADVYVMSSRFEGFPNTLVEAMAHGCAVVSFDCDTGPRDIIRDGMDGILVSPVADVPALSGALDRLMGDDAERQRMALLSVDVRERYSTDNILKLWDAVFESER